LPPRGSSRKEMESRGNRPRPGQGGGAPGAPKPDETVVPAPEAAKTSATKPAGKPQRPAPKPVNLSQDALAGGSPLGSFAELAAFFAATGPEKKAGSEPKPEGNPPAGGEPGGA